MCMASFIILKEFFLAYIGKYFFKKDKGFLVMSFFFTCEHYEGMLYLHYYKYFLHVKECICLLIGIIPIKGILKEKKN